MRRFRVYGRFARRVLLALGLVGTQDVGAIGVERAFAQQSGLNADFELCRAITDDATRLRCLEGATRGHATNSGSRSLGAKAGTWRLVRTPNPAGGPDAVSIMQTADTAKSDLGLAGLALRCQDGGIEVVLVLVDALSLRAHPKVVISAAGSTVDFVATIAPPGVSLLLPPAASKLASGPWTAVAELAIRIEIEQIDGPPSLIRGIIPVAGLRDALPSLLASCPSQ
jgi:hypothetical protein